MARLYRRDGSEYYYADWIDAQGHRHQKSTHRKRARDAQDVADQWERESLRDPVELARSAATLRTALDLLGEHLLQSVKAETMAEDTALFHRAKALRLRDGFGPLRALASIDTAAVRDYCEHRRTPRTVRRPDGSTRETKPASSHTLVKELTTLRLLLRLAKERKLWTGDLDTLQPAELSAAYRPRSRVLTPAEVDALRAELAHSRWRLIAFALATGAELRAWGRAERCDIDLAAGWVRVRGTKRETRARDVPVVLPLCRTLLEEALQGGDTAGMLFAPWPDVGRDLRAACKRANIPHTSPNDLRRTYATWHVEAGVSLDTLFRPMGHVDTTMLARTYAKPSRDVMADAMRAQIAARAKK